MNHASKCVVFADWFGENSFRINSRCVTYSAFNFSSFQYTETNLCASYYYYYYKLQLSCHSVAVVVTPLQTKQIRINIHKQNNTKHSTNNTKHSKYKYTHSENTHTIFKTPTHYKTHTLQSKLKQSQCKINAKSKSQYN